MALNFSLKECNTVSLALPLDEGRVGGGEPSRTMTSPSVPLSPAIKLSGQLQQCFLPRSLPLFIVWGAVWSGLARLADYHVRVDRVRRYRHTALRKARPGTNSALVIKRMPKLKITVQIVNLA